MKEDNTTARMAATTINEEAEALKEAGNKLVAKKKYVEALKKYKKALSIDDDDVKVVIDFDKDGKVVQKLKVDRHTGWMQIVQ